MNKRTLEREFRKLGISKEDYEGLTREEMETLYSILVIGMTVMALQEMTRIGSLFSDMTDILQGKEPQKSEGISDEFKQPTMTFEEDSEDDEQTRYW